MEAHICSVTMQVFNMSAVTDRPCTELFPEGCTKLNLQQRWNMLQLAISKIVDRFVDISYPSPAMKNNDNHVRAYAREVLSLGLLLMEFTEAVREGDRERITRCWKYFLPLFKSSAIIQSRHSTFCFSLSTLWLPEWNNSLHGSVQLMFMESLGEMCLWISTWGISIGSVSRWWVFLALAQILLTRLWPRLGKVLENSWRSHNSLTKWTNWKKSQSATINVELKGTWRSYWQNWTLWRNLTTSQEGNTQTLKKSK